MAVLLYSSWSAVSDADIEVIRRQLGREPQGLLAVARRCHCGAPQVVVNAPVVWGPGRRSERAAGVKPGTPRVFPTMYWLTCPYLSNGVSRLEGRGGVKNVKEWLDQNGKDTAMRQAHVRAAQERVAIAGEDGLKLVAERPAQWQVLAESGIGGIRNPAGVKCLHMHLADYLAGPVSTEQAARNPAGARVAALLLQNGVDITGSTGAAGSSCSTCALTNNC